MQKLAFLFPGQGAQVVGMGHDFFVASEAARRVYQVFDDVVDPQLSSISFEGPEATLKRTLYTQPAILETSIAALELFREQCDVKPLVSAGHSLGEYGALYASGVIDVATAATLVKRRAELMDKASEGAMAAVLGLSADSVESVMADFAASEVNIANYNTAEQFVISGRPESVEIAGEALKAKGAKRVIPLPVGGAFHSALMTPAAIDFKGFLESHTFKSAEHSVITNVDAKETQLAVDFQRKLSEQIDHSVRWQQTMAVMFDSMGIDTVIEFGPGKVLTGMVRKNYRHVKAFNVFDMLSLEKTLAAFKVSATV